MINYNSRSKDLVIILTKVGNNNHPGCPTSVLNFSGIEVRVFKLEQLFQLCKKEEREKNESLLTNISEMVNSILLKSTMQSSSVRKHLCRKFSIKWIIDHRTVNAKNSQLCCSCDLHAPLGPHYTLPCVLMIDKQ